MDITTKVSPSLHPANIEAIEGFNDDTKAYVNPAVEALSTAYVAIEKIHAARDAAEKNQAWTAEHR